MKAINIKWDTDGDEDLLKSLPKEIEIPKHLIGEDVAEDYADEISDYISQVAGYCHFGFDLVVNCESKSKLIDGVTSCCGYDFGVDIEKANYCPICGKKLYKENEAEE